jgi:hypothetical protein
MQAGSPPPVQAAGAAGAPPAQPAGPHAEAAPRAPAALSAARALLKALGMDIGGAKRKRAAQ